MEELISVVVPVYNKKEYLRKCIDSILAQTYTYLEVILVDDGSTDGSSEIVDEYELHDKRVRVVHKENGGLSSARNRGIKEARGKYVGFVDADDYIEKDMYANLCKAYKDYPDITFAQIMSQNVMEFGKVFSPILKNSGETVIMEKRDYFKELLLHIGDSSFCTKLFRNEWLYNYKFAEGELNEDFELLLRMMNDIEKVATIEKLGYNIVLSGESITRGSYNPKLYEDMMKHVDEARALVETRYPFLQVAMTKFELTQCLDFLLHVPVEQMVDKNELYVRCRDTVKKSKKDIKENPYFDERQRKNLGILASYPMPMVRKAHKLVMKVRDN